MADYSFLNVVTIDANNKKRNRKVTYVRPDATKAELDAFAQALGALSEDALYRVQRIIRTQGEFDIDEYLTAIFNHQEVEITTNTDLDTYFDSIFTGEFAQTVDNDFVNYMDGFFAA